MDLRLQPKPEINIPPANKGIVSNKQFFVKKKIEKINQYFFPAHLIRNWRPKAELLYPQVSDEDAIQYECDFNRDIQNCFVEDYAEEVFLRTPPPCFVVIGKCGMSVSKLGREIAKEYGSVLIQVDEIVDQVIKTETATSKFLDRVLRLGVSITLNFILALLSYVAHTAEARHRGYVLCGLPTSPHLYDLSVEQQFNYLFTWENKPTVFINVLFEDGDLVQERTNVRCEVESVGNQTCVRVHSHYNETAESEDEEEEEDELLPIRENSKGYERDIDISPSRPWVQLPRDEESQVWSELELFDVKIKPLIELIISRVDPQYFITVDSRVKNEFEVVKTRLSLLHLWKSPLPFPFIPLKEIKEEERGEEEEEVEEEKGMKKDGTEMSEEDSDILQVADEPPETAFLTLFNKKIISPKYRWELSHYNYICPVSLRAGKVVKGKSEFAVVFMKYIYFLRDRDSMVKFLRNPRPYVLPIRPKPPCRFIILGYPFTGRTTLAKNLAAEFSVPVIDVNSILTADLNRKKTIYEEFCRQKAESRELTRLTALAWQDWRIEEEQRVCLIEEWISYAQTLLERRIQQFYTLKASDDASDKESQVQSYFPDVSYENTEMGPEGSEGWEGSEWEKGSQGKPTEGKEEKPLGVRGVSISGPPDQYQREGTPGDNNSTASEKIIRALKHDDYDFNENGFEVEANLFFSSLWNSFSGEEPRQNSLEKESKAEEDEGERQSEAGEEADVSVNWCSLLPPQSYSSFLLGKKPTTRRERQKSFKMFLEAASKAYWAPSSLKTEFVKWRLPCFMDIPLCEIYLNDPILLLKYIPEWLKERPLIPDPIDPNHPSVIEAGRNAFARAKVVTVRQSTEEMGLLLLDAIEKAEREGMRITGEVVSPGGWVVDNMILDLEAWRMMAKSNVIPDHVYFLIDSEPEFSRIIRTWCDLRCPNELSVGNETETSADEGQKEQRNMHHESERVIKVESFGNGRDAGDNSLGVNKFKLKQLLMEISESNESGNQELDEIYERLMNSKKGDEYRAPQFSIDIFSQNLILSPNTLTNSEEETMSKDNINSALFRFSVLNRHGIPCEKLLLGAQLEIFTDAIINSFKNKALPQRTDVEAKESAEKGVQFFIFLLSLPSRLEKINDWLINLNRGIAIKEIDIVDKTSESVFSEIRSDLLAPFIKKPRELEGFEAEEIREEFDRDLALQNKRSEEEEEEVEGEAATGEEEAKEDVRIYGESGPLCVVNLERNILLLGKQEFALRYYGKLYFFWNEDAKNKFIEDPEKYAPYYSPIRCLPPLRIYVVGPMGSGKTSLALQVSSQCSVKYEDYVDLLNRSLFPHLGPGCESLTIFTGQKLLLSRQDKEAKKAMERFMSASYSKRMFWLYSPIHFPVSNEDMLIDLWSENQTATPSNFPELSYKCIDSISEETDSVGSGLRSDGVQASTEKPFVSMKEMESIVRDYLDGKSNLPDVCAERSLKRLWTEEPHASKGFLLKGFPLKSRDVQLIEDNNWFPDVVVEITLPEDSVVDRNVDRLMEFWNTKLQQEMVEERLLEDAVAAIRHNLMMTERRRLLSEMQTEKERLRDDERDADNDSSEINIADEEYISKEDSGSQLEFGKSQTEEEVKEVLQKRFPELVFNPTFETYDSGKARIVNELVANYRTDVEEIEKIKASLKNADVPWIEINALENPKKNYIEAMRRLDDFKKRSNRRGEFAFTMDMDTAEKLLRQGFYFLSKFGKWCPVQVHRMKNSIHMFRPLSKRGRIIPVAYRNYIYFVGGINEKNKFIEDPIKYTFNEPHHPNIPLRIAVIGPPKSGKSTLCERLGLMFDLKVVTMGSALRFVLERMPETTLAKSINGYLRRGCFLPLSLKVEALTACLNDPVCATQGFIFDGIPFDAALTQSLAEERKLPFVIISLVADSHFGKTNRHNLDVTEFRLRYKNRVNLDSKYKEWGETYKRFLQWNQDTYGNIYELNAKANIVSLFYQAYDIIKKSFFGILYYVEYCVSERALPLQYLCVSQHEYELRKSSFHNNCPACWKESNKLSPSSDPPPRSGLVQYLNHFYWVCPEHAEKFLNRPKAYLPPHCPKFPRVLPKILNRSMFETASLELKIHGFGRCPVTRIDFPSSLDWEGSWDFAVYYGDEVYLCKDRKMMDRFLARPWRYRDADTEFEVSRAAKSEAVELLGPPKVTSLPPVGFLEQTVAELIQSSLHVLGAVRPIYPDLTPTCTGCIFVGLWLKVFNAKKTKLGLDRQLLDFLICYCKAERYRVRPSFKDAPVLGDEVLDRESPAEGESFWKDFDLEIGEKIWTAKGINEELTKMNFVESENALEDIPEVPKNLVVLKFQTYSLRPNPIPPLPNCLCYIYCSKLGMKLPRKFNYNSLYQSDSSFSSPYPRTTLFNPDKEFGVHLLKETESEFPSEPNLWQGERVISDSTFEVCVPEIQDPDLNYMVERFIPRFQLFDSVTGVKVPPVPKVVEEEAIVFNPHRDYAYVMLLSQFFQTTHVLRCYQWSECRNLLEHSDRLDKNLGLTSVRIEYFHSPKRAESVATRRSILSYQDIFDAATLFAVRDEGGSTKTDSGKSEDAQDSDSLVEFMRLMVWEKMNEMFNRLSSSYLSYDSCDFSIISSQNDRLLIREVLPFPPLPWDIVSRPYHAYCSIPPIFSGPDHDPIVHARLMSVLDGITEPFERFTFVRRPKRFEDPFRGEGETSGTPRDGNRSKRSKFHFVYNFFDLPWTSFLTYPFSWAYNRELRENFEGANAFDDSPSTELVLNSITFNQETQ